MTKGDQPVQWLQRWTEGINVLEVDGSIPDECVFPYLFQDPFPIAKDSGWVTVTESDCLVRFGCDNLAKHQVEDAYLVAEISSQDVNKNYKDKIFSYWIFERECEL